MPDDQIQRPWWAQDIRNWLKWWSNRWVIICGAIAEVSAEFWPQIQQHVSPQVALHLAAASFWATIVWRVLKQSKLAVDATETKQGDSKS